MLQHLCFIGSCSFTASANVVVGSCSFTASTNMVGKQLSTTGLNLDSHLYTARNLRVIYCRIGLSSTCAYGDDSKGICAT